MSYTEELEAIKVFMRNTLKASRGQSGEGGNNMDYESMWAELYELLLSCEENVKSNMDVVRKMRAIREKHFEDKLHRKPLTASEMGKIGGASTSEAKSKSSAANGKLGGRPKRTIDTKEQ